MIKLQKENVIKIVDSSLKRDKLVKQGFVSVQAPAKYLAAEEEEFDEEIQEPGPKLEEKKTKTTPSKAKK